MKNLVKLAAIGAAAVVGDAWSHCSGVGARREVAAGVFADAHAELV